MDVQQTLTILDIVFLLPLFWGVYRGFINGFIAEALATAFFLIGLYLYIRLIELPESMQPREIARNLEYLPLLGFFFALLVVIFISNLVGRLVRRNFLNMAITPVNRFVGIFIGTFKLMLIVSCFVVILDKTNEKYNILSYEDTQASFLYSPLKSIIPAIFPYFNFDDIKNTEYIRMVKKGVIQINDGQIKILHGLEAISGDSGNIKWNSYKSDAYKDNHDLVIVSAQVENHDQDIVRTAKYEFMLNKDSEEVELHSFMINGAAQKKVLGLKSLMNGKI